MGQHKLFSHEYDWLLSTVYLMNINPYTAMGDYSRPTSTKRSLLSKLIII